MAIVHIAIFEAVNAVSRSDRSYIGLPTARTDLSLDAAIAQAAHDAQVSLYPSQSPRLDARLASDTVQRAADASRLVAGRALGAAASIVAIRQNNGVHWRFDSDAGVAQGRQVAD